MPYQLWRNAKRRADRLGVPFSITPEDVVIPNFCPVLGIPLESSTRHSTDQSPTIDRLIPELGYVPGNIAVISHRANTIKGVGTSHEHRQIARWQDAHNYHHSSRKRGPNDRPPRVA